MLISLVAPVYNEEKNIHRLYDEVKKALNNIYDFELILINDGSKDKSIEKIKEVVNLDNRVKYINFSRNFGKESAMLAGLKASKGDCIVILDSDLQHPPSLIPDLIKEYLKGYDQVVMKRDRDGEAFLRKAPTQLFYKSINKVTDITFTDGEGDFRLMSRKVVNAILELGEYNRFSKGIFEWVGFNKKTIPFKNVEREEGNSSFNFLKLLDYAIDGILSYNNKPLRVCFYLGGIVMSICLLYILITFFQILSGGINEPGYFTIISSILFLGSLQLFSLGVIGEYIGRIYYETKERPHFIIKDTNVSDHDE